jgi:ABC-type dipeptide/oligopeptide/nickel transport system ATPase subunit
LIIGKTGNGKSTVANVISGTNDFKEGALGVSQTKNFQKGTYNVDGIEFVIVDTIGIGDTKLTVQEVLNKIADACYTIKGGVNQVLFVTSTRFTDEEIMCYEILTSVIFNPTIIKHTTIVKTRFPKFKESAICNEDIKSMQKENEKIAHVVTGCNKIIHVNNLTVDEEPSLKSRKDSKMRLVTHLAGCREIYKPAELDELNDKIRNYMTEKEKLAKELEELGPKLEEAQRSNTALAADLQKQKTEYDNKLAGLTQEVAKTTGQKIQEKSPGVFQIIGSALDEVAGSCTIS